MDKGKEVCILIVWCEVPESTDLVYIKVNRAIADRVRRFHDHYINGTDNEALAKEINEFFYAPNGRFLFDKSNEPFEPDEDNPIDMVIVTGMIV